MSPESAALAAAPAVPPAAEAGLTTFYVFTASDDLLTFRYVASVQAHDRDQALRKHFGKNPPLSVAVSEHAWRPRKPKVEAVIRGLTDVSMPSSAVRAADAPAPVAVADGPSNEELADP